MTTIHFTYQTERTLMCQRAHLRFPIWFAESYDNNHGSIAEVMGHWKVVVEWCVDQFGPAGDRWGFNIDPDSLNYVCFRDAADATAFRIRWG